MKLIGWVFIAYGAVGALLCGLGAWMAGDAGGLATSLAWLMAGVHATGIVAGWMLLKGMRGAVVLAAFTALGAVLALPTVIGIVLHVVTRA